MADKTKKTLPASYQPGDWAYGIRVGQEQHGFRATDTEIAFNGDPLIFIEAVQQQVAEAEKPLRARIAELEGQLREARQPKEE